MQLARPAATRSVHIVVVSVVKVPTMDLRVGIRKNDTHAGDARQLAILRRVTSRTMSVKPTNEYAAMALGELRGHLRSKEPTGRAILGRALETLLVMNLR